MTTKARKFTFKKQPKETGLAAIGHPYPDVDIKLKKLVIGYIDAPTHLTLDSKWRIRLKVVNVNMTPGWQWITLKGVFDTEKEARTFLQLHTDEILRRWPVYGVWKPQQQNDN